jgi:hypothetical protein
MEEAIGLQKETISFMILEGAENDFGSEELEGDYGWPIETRISMGVRKLQKLRGLIATDP